MFLADDKGKKASLDKTNKKGKQSSIKDLPVEFKKDEILEVSGPCILRPPMGT